MNKEVSKLIKRKIYVVAKNVWYYYTNEDGFDNDLVKAKLMTRKEAENTLEMLEKRKERGFYKIYKIDIRVRRPMFFLYNTFTGVYFVDFDKQTFSINKAKPFYNRNQAVKYQIKTNGIYNKIITYTKGIDDETSFN